MSTQVQTSTTSPATQTTTDVSVTQKNWNTRTVKILTGVATALLGAGLATAAVFSAPIAAIAALAVVTFSALSAFITSVATTPKNVTNETTTITVKESVEGEVSAPVAASVQKPEEVEGASQTATTTVVAEKKSFTQTMKDGLATVVNYATANPGKTALGAAAAAALTYGGYATYAALTAKAVKPPVCPANAVDKALAKVKQSLVYPKSPNPFATCPDTAAAKAAALAAQAAAKKAANGVCRMPAQANYSPNTEFAKAAAFAKNTQKSNSTAYEMIRAHYNSKPTPVRKVLNMPKFSTVVETSKLPVKASGMFAANGNGSGSGKASAGISAANTFHAIPSVEMPSGPSVAEQATIALKALKNETFSQWDQFQTSASSVLDTIKNSAARRADLLSNTRSGKMAASAYSSATSAATAAFTTANDALSTGAKKAVELSKPAMPYVKDGFAAAGEELSDVASILAGPGITSTVKSITDETVKAFSESPFMPPVTQLANSAVDYAVEQPLNFVAGAAGTGAGLYALNSILYKATSIGAKTFAALGGFIAARFARAPVAPVAPVDAMRAARNARFGQ
jgi:hypothetical protein